MKHAETLRKLLRLGPLSQLNAFMICGWSLSEFDQAVTIAMDHGWIRLARGGNQHITRLEAA